MQQLPLSVRLRDTARFSSYVRGRNSEAVQLLAAGPQAAPRVLWLWGRAGTGKTHLLQAACAAVGGQGGAATYLDLQHDAEPAWLEGCESLDLVCLDGIDAAAATADWSAAIFRLHTLMQDLAGRLCVSSTQPPASVPFHLPDLRSRLLAGSVHQLHELDEGGQLEALRLRARQRGLDLSEDAAAYLVHRVPRDMHTLCAVFDQLDEASLAAQRRLTVPFLKDVLESHDPETR